MNEFDDTMPAPPRRKVDTSSEAEAEADAASVAADGEIMGDTVMTAPHLEHLVEHLVEPRRDVPTPEAILAAIDASLPPCATDVRPGLCGFRVGTGADAVLLDVPARIGREPAAPRILTGPQPRLVRVDSPRNEVSATHLELRQVGASVIVTDLRSTNGSVVMQPGSVPQKLRQGESVVVAPGTLVDIGDETILQVLGMQRLG